MDPATKAWHFALERFVVFLRDVIEPAVYPLSVPLDAAVWQTREPVPFARAARARFKPVKPGFTWGPSWSTAWFRVTGRVPEAFAAQRVVLRFSTDTEALCWRPTGPARGVPLQGLDANRDAVALFDRARPGAPVELFVEAACNHLFGHRGLQWDPPEIHRRWNSSTPGYFERCELAVLDERVRRLKLAYSFALQLAKELAPKLPRARELHAALTSATNAMRDDHVAQDSARALAILEPALKSPPPASSTPTLCHAVGHAHIDTAWLWPLRETRRKCLRTFSNVLRSMERYPEFRFLCSQAQQYAYVEEDAPELFAQIKRRVAQGRWEPGGAMWIEPDCTCPSGESLARQTLHADRYWRSRFGDARARQRFLYLPDTFGWPAQIPQIMRLAGLDTFITNKLHWNSHTVFPHTTFTWRGLDGSEVLAHNTPGMDYNATMTPRELIRGVQTHKNPGIRARADKARGFVGDAGARWLQPFGFGDGGGGPTDWSIEFARFARQCAGLPRVVPSSVTHFCDALHNDAARARRSSPRSVPVHQGELYLELHRGTYTTHARIKHANVECEELLRHAEILTFAGPTPLPRSVQRTAKADLDRAWKLLLLNQFHDILPGSSITWVYQDALKDYARIRAIARPLIESGLRRWGAQLDCTGFRKPVLVFNPASDAAIASLPARRGFTSTSLCAELEVSVVDTAPPGGNQPPWLGPATLKARTLANPWFTATLDDSGGLSAFTDARGRHDLCASGSILNALTLFEDRPRLWDAWDIDEEYRQKPVDDRSRGTWTTLVNDPHRVVVELARPLGDGSAVVIRYICDALSPALQVELDIDWCEEHRFLRALFPTTVRASHATFGTQFGALARTTKPAPAAFEVPFQRFMHLGTRSKGLGVLAPTKYGASVHGSLLGLSLLRSTRYPDPTADVGLHSIRYALLHHADARSAAREAEALARPLLVRPVRAGTRSGPVLGQSWSPLSIDTDSEAGSICIDAIKPAHDDDRLIVRLHNRTAAPVRATIAWSWPVASVAGVDLLERPLPADRSVRHDQRSQLTGVAFKPWQIVTLAVERRA